MAISSQSICSLLEQLIDEESKKTPRILASSDFYNRTYRLHLKDFKRLRRRAWTEDKVLMCFCSVYGWMPKAIVEWNKNAIPRFVEALNAETSPSTLIELAKSCINNSVVGASKFLHFYDPDTFPIFDSIVASIAWSCWSQDAALSRYLRYREAVMSVSTAHTQSAKCWAEEWFGYGVSGVRAIEGLTFYSLRKRVSGKPPETCTAFDISAD